MKRAAVGLGLLFALGAGHAFAQSSRHELSGVDVDTKLSSWNLAYGYFLNPQRDYSADPEPGKKRDLGTRFSRAAPVPGAMSIGDVYILHDSTSTDPSLSYVNISTGPITSVLLGVWLRARF